MKDKLFKVTVVSGTNRALASSLQITKNVYSIVQKYGGDGTILDLAKLPVGLFESTSYQTKPREFKSWQDEIDGSHALILCIPEYNGAMPGILKYFIDMLRYPDTFLDKHVLLIGVTSSRTPKYGGILSTASILKFQRALVFDRHICVTRCNQVFSEDGELVDLDMRNQLEVLVYSFLDSCYGRRSQDMDEF